MEQFKLTLDEVGAIIKLSQYEAERLIKAIHKYYVLEELVVVDEGKPADIFRAIGKRVSPTVGKVNENDLSADFREQWDALLAMPKWKNKTKKAIELSLKKLRQYEEPYAILLIETAIMGSYQGLVFSDTDAKYKAWQRRRDFTVFTKSEQNKAKQGLFITNLSK